MDVIRWTLALHVACLRTDSSHCVFSVRG